MARGFNKAIIIGNLAKDPEIRYTASGTATARLVVAVNRTWTKNGEKHEECDFIPAVVWDKMAENCDRYLRKGSALLVEGRISVRSYEGRDGQKKYATEIVAQTVQFLGSGQKSENVDGYVDDYKQHDKRLRDGKEASQGRLPDGFEQDSENSEDDEDIPF